MITAEGNQTNTSSRTHIMACTPSPVQTLEDPMYPFGYEDLSLYDPYNMIIKSEPDKDFSCLSTMSSCSDTLASPLPSFDQTFYNACPYSPVDRSGCLQSWTAQHPENWSSQDVLDWVYFVAEKNSWDASKIRGEHFQNITGQHLCRMQRDDFISCDDIFGAHIYEILQQLLTGAKFSEPKCDTNLSSDGFSMLPPQPYMEDRLTDISNSTCTEDGIKVLIGADIYDIDIKIPIEIPGVDSAVEPIDPGYYSESSTDFDRDSDSHSESMDMDPFTHDIYSPSCLPSKYRSHSDSLSSLYSDASDESEPVSKPPPKKHTNRGRPAGQASKGNHLWEFIRDTLKDSNFNPALLKWEDKEEGVFRFVQSEAVAQMWGRKKNNKGMTYEKLSRAMRYYYKRGILDRVDGKRLVYKFGKNSHGWKN